MAEVVNHVFGLNEVYSKINRGAWPLWIDAIPDEFTFIDQTGVQLSTTVTSNTITVSGITTGTPITIAGGTYSINGGAYTSVDGTVNNGNTVTVRHTSSASAATAVNTILSIGEVSDTFTSITLSGDTVPDTFSFNAAPSVEPSTTTTSNTATITGLIGPSPISITGGTYSINGGAYTSAAGTITNNATLTLRHVSSASYSTATTTTVNIGGVTAQFISTTRAIDTTPNSFSFTATTGANPSTSNTSNTITVSGLDSGAAASVTITGGNYSKNGAAVSSAATTAVNGDTFYVTGTSSSSYSTTTSVILTIGGINGTYSITTRAADTIPNAFSFTSRSSATVSTSYTSNTITVSGLDSGVSTSVSVSGGTYSKNSGTSTTGGTTAVNGDTFSVSRSSSASYSTTVSVTLTIGGVAGTYSITTEAAPDTTPNVMNFTAQTGAELSTDTTSNTISVSGINTQTPISNITGGTYSKNGGAFTSAAGTVVAGDTIALKVTSSASYNTSASATITIGGVNSTFSVTTRAANTVPNNFNSYGSTQVEPNTVKISGPNTVSGMDTGVSTPISISGNGLYSKNGGAYTATAGTMVNGDTFTIQVTASSALATSVVATVTVGTKTATYTVTTRDPDSVPNAYDFINVTNGELSTTYTSNTITISGLEPGYSIPYSIAVGTSVTGASHSKNGGAFVSTTNGTTVNGDTFTLRLTTSNLRSTNHILGLNIGGFQDSFNVTTKA